MILMHMMEHTPQFFLSDSTLLDLGSTFNHYLSLGTCALLNNTLSIFMLGGSIQIHSSVSVKTNHTI